MKSDTSENIENCENCAGSVKHSNTTALVNRISGQVTAIGRMITEDRYCPDILNQIRAARSALRTLESRVLENHLQSCVRDAFASGDHTAQTTKIDEIIKLFSRYDTTES